MIEFLQGSFCFPFSCGYDITISTGCQLKCLNIYRLAKDHLLAEFIVSKDHGNFCGFRFDASRETDSVIAGASTNEIEGNMEAVHCVSLVCCCV